MPLSKAIVGTIDASELSLGVELVSESVTTDGGKTYSTRERAVGVARYTVDGEQRSARFDITEQQADAVADAIGQTALAAVKATEAPISPEELAAAKASVKP